MILLGRALAIRHPKQVVNQVLKNGSVELVADELPFSLCQDQFGLAQYS